MLPENSQLTQVYFSIFNILAERGIDKVFRSYLYKSTYNAPLKQEVIWVCLN